jgi:hypothetical protein
MAASSADVKARIAARKAQEELAERQKIAELTDAHGVARDAVTAKIDAALIVLRRQHQTAGESSSAFLKRLKIDPALFLKKKERLKFLNLYHPDAWRQHILDFDETQFSDIFTADERLALGQRFQDVLAPLAKSIAEAIEAAKPRESAANLAAERAQQNSNAATANAATAAAKAATASGKAKERLEEEAARLAEDAKKAEEVVRVAAAEAMRAEAAKARAPPAASAGGSSSARAPPPAASAGGSSARDPPPAASASGFRAGFGGSSAPPAASASGFGFSAGGFGAGGSSTSPADETGGFRAGGVGAGGFRRGPRVFVPGGSPWNSGAGGFGAGGSPWNSGGFAPGGSPWNSGAGGFGAGAPSAHSAASAEANAAFQRQMHETLEREGGRREPSLPEAANLPPKSLGQLEREKLARKYAAAEWAAGAPEREAAAEKRRNAEGLAAFEAFMEAQTAQLRAEIAFEERRQTAEQARLFRERYGERARRGDQTPYQLAIFAATRAANRRREEERVAAAAAWIPAAQTAGRSRTGENGGAPAAAASSGGASSGTPSDVWLSEGLVGRMVVATSEEQELFMRNEFWEVLSHAKCKEPEKRNSFWLYSRPDENFNRFYERVKSNRRANGLSIEEPSSCTASGGRRRSKKRAQRKRRVTRNRKH